MSDLIDRQAAIASAISGRVRTIDGENWIRTSEVRESLKNLPTITAEPRWIPVTERLPGDMAEILVTWVNHKPMSYYEHIKDKPNTSTAVFYRGKWYWWTTYTQDLLAEYGERCNVGLLDEAVEVIAWMPLPQPWKGADDE